MKSYLSIGFLIIGFVGASTPRLRGGKETDDVLEKNGEQEDLAERLSVPFDIEKLEGLDKNDRDNELGGRANEEKGEINRDLQKRIVGGVEATNSSPDRKFMAMILENKLGRYYPQGCGAVIIGKKFAITAAHCASANLEDDNVAKINAVYVNPKCPWQSNPPNCGGEYQMIKVNKVHQHPSHKPGVAQSHDLALLELDKEVDDDFEIIPIAGCSLVEELKETDDMVVMGMGATRLNGKMNAKLKEATVPFVNNEHCNEKMTPHGAVVDDTMMCAGGEGEDFCNGDSGGPVVMNGRLYGIVSWSFQCAVVGYPSVYAKVCSALDWIQEFNIDGLQIINASESNGPDEDAAGEGNVSVSVSGPQLSVKFGTPTSQKTYTQEDEQTQCEDSSMMLTYLDQERRIQQNKQCSQIPTDHCDLLVLGSGDKIKERCPQTCSNC
mmetsp:Transcript_19664/g.39865  ORF Transcript_19664/g.39865 Transcript_19664/m.39865 type:complete len:438 (-) Transcript_19664:242-1555(-)